MTILFLILILIAAIVLGFIILVQNPKGGGLAGNIAGISTQFMGVKQTTDVLEKGTWVFSGAIALLCIFSTFFMNGGTTDNGRIKDINTTQGTAPARTPAPQQQPAPAPQQPK